MIGVLDLRSLGYYKIKQDVLQQNLHKHYHFESAETVCKQFNRFVNLLKKKEESTEENYGEQIEKLWTLKQFLLDKGRKERGKRLVKWVKGCIQFER